MLSAKATTLFRVAPRLIAVPSLSTEIRPLRFFINRLCTFSCQSKAVVCTNSHSQFWLLPKRNLAGDVKEDYILSQNSLTEAERKEIDASVKKDFEDWVPYGFCPTDKEEDIFRYKMFLFSGLTLGVVVFMYIVMHMPPKNNREWVTREAYLELERRDRLGLPLVDPNLIPADRILLPSLDELGDDYDIII